MKGQFKRELDKYYDGMLNQIPDYEEKYEELNSDYPEYIELFFGDRVISNDLFYLFKENVEDREVFIKTMGYKNGYLFHYNMMNRVNFVYQLIHYHLLDDGGYSINPEYTDMLNHRKQAMSKSEVLNDLPLDFYAHVNLPPMFVEHRDRYKDIIGEVPEMLKLLQNESKRILDERIYRRNLMMKKFNNKL